VKHKEFIEELSNKSGIDKKTTEMLVNATGNIISNILTSGDSISIQGFGTFIVKKRDERISVIPSTGKRLLIPPKIVPGFKPGTTLKEKIKNLNNNG